MNALFDLPARPVLNCVAIYSDGGRLAYGARDASHAEYLAETMFCVRAYRVHLETGRWERHVKVGSDWFVL